MVATKGSLLKAYGLTEEILRNPEKLTYWAEFKKLSLLHLTVILGDKADVEKILNLEINLNSRDKCQWTPLHHAALFGKTDIIQFLLENGADPNLRNTFNGTYQDILNLTHLSPKDPQEKIPVFYKETHQSEERQLNALEYEKITESKYIEEDFISPEILIAFWHLNSSKILNAYSKKEYKPLKKDFAYTLLAPSHEGAAITGLGVFAKRDYTPFEIVGEYCGIIENVENNYSAKFESLPSEKLVVNSKFFSNAMSRINDGFPNLVLVWRDNTNGLPVRLLLMTVENISKGSQLCFNYGNHKIKEGPYIELRGKELREFLETYDVENYKEVSKDEIFLNSVSDHDYVIWQKFTYVLNSPVVVFALILDGSISPEKGQKIIEIAIKKALLPLADEPFYRSIAQVASLWRQSERQEAIQYALSLIQRMPFKQAIALLEKGVYY